MQIRRRFVTYGGLVFALLVPLAARAWSERAEFGTRVHAHAFHKVVLESSDCLVYYRIYFSAPNEAYGAGKRYYRFRARIKLNTGKMAPSSVFGNSGPGERVYEGTYDTRPEGCWASEAQKVVGVDVKACRGRGCTPEPFD